MPGPSDIRVNPFNNATNYVNLTERHIVPSVSPFVVRLNEVPEKQDPSNMQMYYVDDTTGQTTETALTEVAATPGAGEFRPDYSTNAFDDTSWNTGLIEFSFADAGKIIEVSYTGTGTLAGVNSNHWPSWYTDRGDGSDGDFAPTEDTTISGVKNYKSVFIKSGITVTVDKYTYIKCQGGFVNNGTIRVKGAAGGAIATKGDDGYFAVGGAGSKGNTLTTPPAGGGFIAIRPELTDKELLIDYIFNIHPLINIYSGGGGGGAWEQQHRGEPGDGGDGGGSILIVANEVLNNSVINANGENGESGGAPYGSGGGGGGGGLVIIIANVCSEGTITVNGGTAGTGWSSAADGADGMSVIKVLGVE